MDRDGDFDKGGERQKICINNYFAKVRTVYPISKKFKIGQGDHLSPPLLNLTLDYLKRFSQSRIDASLVKTQNSY